MTYHPYFLRRRTVLCGLVILLAGLATIFLNQNWHSSNRSAPAQVPPVSATPADSPARSGTVASAWQWQETSPAGKTSGTPLPATARNTDIPFTAEGIYQALQNVRIDESGNVVLDDQALEALNRALHSGNVELSEQNLADLQELIQVGLPGKAGQQTARIAVDYYRYLGAAEELNTLYAPLTSAGSEDAAFRRQYRELQALRDQYLGPEVASKLFATENASADYMFAARRIQQDDSLSQQEKAEASAVLQEKLARQTAPIENWQERRARFRADKQRILQAGLAEEEKRAQIESLMQQHFQPEEREKIRHLGIDDF